MNTRPTINSLANEKVKYVRSLDRKRVREQEGRFVVEGARILEDALRAGIQPALVFFVPGIEDSDRGAALLERLSASTREIYPVTVKIMEAVSDTVTPQGILAVMPLPHIVPSAGDLVLVVDGVQDPGNLGTLLRSSEAAGVGEVVIAPGSVDAFGPKVVRAGAGVHFRLAIAEVSWDEMRARLAGKQVLLAEEDGLVAYYEIDWVRPSALIVSNEGAGPSAGARAVASARVAIPMRGGTESLNVGVAGSIILFEAARQRRLRSR